MSLWRAFRQLSGIWALVVVIFSTIIFTLLDPTYDHSKQSFSELGALGAPNYIAFNIVTFGVAGILSLIFLHQLKNEYSEEFFTSLYIFQLLAGFSWIMTGVIPASFENSLIYNLHIAAAFSTYVFGTITITLTVKLFNFVEGYTFFSLVSIWVMFAVFFSIVLSFGEPLITPEWGQLISIFSFFGWQAAYSYLLYRNTTNT